MPHKDTSGNIIGAGEETTFNIMKRICPTWWNIKTQVPIEKLISKEDYDFLDEEHQKGPIDIAVWAHDPDDCFEAKWIGVVRVQGPDHGSGKTGQQHQHKSKKDSIQLDILKKNKFWVVDVFFRECPNIFKERYNCDSVIELCNMFKMAKVKIDG